MKHWRKASALSLIAGISLALSGCTQSPLSPENPAQNPGANFHSVAPPIVRFGADSVDYVSAPVGSTVDGSVNLAAGLPTSVRSTVKMDGSLGGTLRAGRFSVKLPPGAFNGTAIVTLSMPDSTVMVCELSISPSSANRFRYPAQLTADLSSASITDASTFTTFWYNPTRLTWVNLSAKSSTSGSTITTALDHFSTYASGKAGW